MFSTASHPEKSESDLEGPGLLLQVKAALAKEGLDALRVVAVGGINESNCGIVMEAGADGVAVIQALSSPKVGTPIEAARRIREALNRQESRGLGPSPPSNS